MRLRRNKNYTTIILEDFTDQELLIVGKTKADFIEKGNASIVKASKIAVEKYFDSLEESAKEIFNGEKAGSYELDGIRFSLIPTTENIIPKKLYYIFYIIKTYFNEALYFWLAMVDWCCIGCKMFKIQYYFGVLIMSMLVRKLPLSVREFLFYLVCLIASGFKLIEHIFIFAYVLAMIAFLSGGWLIIYLLS